MFHHHSISQFGQKKLKSNLNDQGEYREKSQTLQWSMQKWAAWCKESWGKWEKKWLPSMCHHHSISQFGQKKLKSNLNNQGEYREKSQTVQWAMQKWTAWCKKSRENWEKKLLSSTFHHHSISQFGQKNLKLNLNNQGKYREESQTIQRVTQKWAAQPILPISIQAGLDWLFYIKVS